MKQIKYIVAGLAVSALLNTSCSDSFLEVESPVNPTIEEYFTTDEHIREAIVAAYDPLHWPDWGMNEYNPVNIMSEIMADNIWVGGQDKTDNRAWHLMMNYEAQPTYVMSGLWSVAYSGVKRCNDVIKYLEWAEDVTEDNVAYYAAQVKVLRVFYYNWLWKFWGNIPYYEENLETPFIAKQYKADEVYEFMIKDLESVLNNKNNLEMKVADPENYGRVTKAMAYMLYAEIVMYQKDSSRYGKALEYMEEIINPSSGYKLVNDYTTIFEEEGEWNEESIFEINYKDDNAVRSWSAPLVAGGTVLPSLISPHSWPGTEKGIKAGWGFCPVRKEVVDLFEEGDTRGPSTCFNAAGVEYNKRYQDTGYFLEKYIAKDGNNKDQKADSEINWNNNLRIYRFSEALLNAAELIVLTGGDIAKAKTFLNDVRRRAFGDNNIAEIAASIDNIINERRLEFVGEGKRYWDLIRTGKAASTLIPDSYGYRTNTWTESKKYLPIPQSEIDAAQGTLTQNNY